MYDLKTDEKTGAQILGIYDALNRALFGGELPRPGFILDDLMEISGARTIGAFFTPDNIPSLEKPSICIDVNGANTLVSTGDFESWALAITDIMSHEMIHYYCHIHEIADHDAEGLHTKLFRDEAERHGLVCEYQDGLGWGLTSITYDGWAIFARAMDDETAETLGWNL